MQDSCQFSGYRGENMDDHGSPKVQDLVDEEMWI